MSARLEKRRTVLHHSHVQLGHVVYGSRDDEGTLLEVIYIPEATVAEMGSPEEITITVEPGDRLNT